MRWPSSAADIWYTHAMLATIDKAGRVVVPAEIRRRLGLKPGTQVELKVEGFTLRLLRAVPGPQVTRRRGRLVARPRAPEHQRTQMDVARLIEEERERWPL